MLNDEYEFVEKHSHAVMKEVNYVDKASVDWELVHLKTAMVEVHKCIKNFEARVKDMDASTKVQE